MFGSLQRLKLTSRKIGKWGKEIYCRKRKGLRESLAFACANKNHLSLVKLIANSIEKGNSYRKSLRRSGIYLQEVPISIIIFEPRVKSEREEGRIIF